VSMSALEAERRIPGLVTEGRSFHWVEEVSLDPRDLCAALPLAAAAAGVVLQESTEVLAVRSHAEWVEITTSGGTISASAFVNCSGAWAANIQHPDLRRQPAAGVEPWKGQIFRVHVEPPLDLAYVLRSPEVYLVPRGGGQIVIGATVERAGFDRWVDPMTIRRLQAQAAELWPPIASARVVESWTGLRPGTSDGLPVIGSAGRPGCWVATGHFRNGILLAPATGLIVRQLLQGGPPAVGLEAFAPGRPSK
jgi:glycine oxidase